MVWRSASSHSHERNHDFAFPISRAKAGDNPREFYLEQVALGAIKKDERQLAALEKLEQVWKGLREMKEPAKASSLASMFGFGGGAPAAPMGLYMYGGVGCGKTFVMDIFFVCAPVKQKRRAHFHGFMLEVHQRLHRIRTAGLGRADVATVAREMVAEGGRLLCFDEFNVTDVGDAVILKNLFEAMWAEGAVVVATSNRHPTELYKNGIQRELFVPCIKQIQEKCEVFDLDSSIDFRLLMTCSDKMYLVTGEDPDEVYMADRELDKIFAVLAKNMKLRGMNLVTQGRTFRVKATAGGVASFDFEEVCSQPTGASDFIAIAKAFHTVILHNVPFLSMERLPEVRRLITLIDVLYDHHVKLLCSAAAEPFKLFRADKNAANDEAFAFDRTASRLNDMMSEEYKLKQHNPTAATMTEDVEIAPGVAELHHELCKEEVDAIWDSYDRDGTGSLDKKELRALLEDLSQLKKGHRNVREAIVDEAWEVMDRDGDGRVDKEEFKSFAERKGVSVWYIV